MKRFAVVLLVFLSALAIGCSKQIKSSDDEPSSTVQAEIQEPTPEEREDEAPAQTGQIYLYGERHGAAIIMKRELELWKQYYDDGMRDLFVEVPYYTAAFLNLWMQSESDELFDLAFQDWDGTLSYTQRTYDFYQQIKSECPDTVFHGIDVGHQYNTTGARYLAYLQENGFGEESEEYQLAAEAMEQGRLYYEQQDHAYRENTMAANFIREYETLDGASVMGIFGSAHVAVGEMKKRARRQAWQASSRSSMEKLCMRKI